LAAAQAFDFAGVGLFIGYGNESIAWGAEVFASKEWSKLFALTNHARSLDLWPASRCMVHPVPRSP
jgi:hypothetical protein